MRRILRTVAISVLVTTMLTAGSNNAAAAMASTDVAEAGDEIGAVQIHRVNTTWLLTLAIPDGTEVNADGTVDLERFAELDIAGLIETIRAEFSSEVGGVEADGGLIDLFNNVFGDSGVELETGSTYGDLLGALETLAGLDDGPKNPANNLAMGWVLGGAIAFFVILAAVPVIHDVVEEVTKPDTPAGGAPDGGTSGSEPEEEEEEEPADEDPDGGTEDDEEDPDGGTGDDDDGGEDTEMTDPDMGPVDPFAFRAYLLALNPGLEGTEYDRLGQAIDYIAEYAAGNRPVHSNPVPIDDGNGGDTVVEVETFGCIGAACGVVDPTEESRNHEITPEMLEKILTYGGPGGPAVSYPPLDEGESQPGGETPPPTGPGAGCEMC